MLNSLKLNLKINIEGTHPQCTSALGQRCYCVYFSCVLWLIAHIFTKHLCFGEGYFSSNKTIVLQQTCHGSSLEVNVDMIMGRSDHHFEPNMDIIATFEWTLTLNFMQTFMLPYWQFCLLMEYSITCDGTCTLAMEKIYCPNLSNSREGK